MIEKPTTSALEESAKRLSRIEHATGAFEPTPPAATDSSSPTGCNVVEPDETGARRSRT